MPVLRVVSSKKTRTEHGRSRLTPKSSDQTARSNNQYRYVGKEKDSESGLYYYGARYYAAWTCRFISVDPLAHDYPHYTPYQYAGNKPINKVDIDGLEEEGGETKPAVPPATSPQQTPTLTDKIKQGVDQIKQTVSEGADKLERKAGEVKKEVTDTAERVSEATSKMTEARAVKETIEIATNLCPKVASLSEEQKQAAFKSSTRETVGIMLYEFATGTGPANGARSFGSDAAITKSIMSMDIGLDAIDKFYSENIGRSGADVQYVEHRYQMTPNSIGTVPGTLLENAKMLKEIFVDDDWVRVFLGSCTFRMTPANGSINVEIVDSKSRSSLYFHAGPIWDRAKDVARDPNNPQPLTTTTQRYTTSMKIDPERLKTWQQKAMDFFMDW